MKLIHFRAAERFQVLKKGCGAVKRFLERFGAPLLARPIKFSYQIIMSLSTSGLTIVICLHYTVLTRQNSNEGIQRLGAGQWKNVFWRQNL